MGRSQKPLTILVDPSLADWSEITDLSAKGHTVVVPHDLKIAGVDWKDLDIILGPQCWRMDRDHRMYVDLAVLAARRVKYPKES